MPRKSRADKKGEIELQFSWVFALISGIGIMIIVVLLFTRIGSSATVSREESNLKSIKTILADLDDGSFKRVENSQRLIIDCETSSISSGAISQEFAGSSLFSPRLIAGDFNSWSFLSKIPFAAQRNLYFFPAEKGFEVTDPVLKSYFPEGGDDKITIGVNSPGDIKVDTQSKKVTIDGVSYDYFGHNPLLVGIIVSDDKECAINKFAQMVQEFSRTYSSRASYLRQEYMANSDSECAHVFGRAQSLFDEAANGRLKIKEMEDLAAESNLHGCANVY